MGLNNFNPSFMLKKSKGFTLIELLLSIALISLIAGMSVPIFSFMQSRNDIDVAQSSVAQNLRQAQISAQASENDSPWGVKIEKGKITLFKGSSFIARDVAFDRITNLPSTVNPYDLTEIIFAKFSGETQNTGTITLKSLNNETRLISINNKGMLSF